MSSFIGTKVFERDAGDAPALIPASLSDIGIMVESARGLPDKAVRITSSAQARVRYGAYRPATDYGAVVLRDMFKNAGNNGINVYVVRITAGDGVAATTGNLTTGSTTFTARTVGVAGNDYNVTIEDGTGGVPLKKVTLQDHPTTPTVTEVFDDIDLTNFYQSINRGVAGINGGNPSTIIRVSLMGSSLPVNIALTNLAGGTATVAALLKTVGASVTATVIKGGQKGLSDPGAWGNDLKVTIEPDVNVPDRRNVSVYLVDSDGQQNLVEEWLQLSKTTMLSNINHTGTGSEYIYIATMGELPDEVTSQAFTTGADGGATTLSDYQGVQASGTGIFAFDAVEIQLLTASDLNSKEMANEMESYCSTSTLILAVASTPFNTSLTTLEDDWRDFLQQAKAYLAVYRGWVEVDDGAGGTVYIPNVGHVIGAAYIRRMFDGGGLPSIAPAGDSSRFDGANNIEYPSYSEADLVRLVHHIGINAIMFKAGAGFVVRTSRTMSSLSKWYSVHVRRSANFLKASYAKNLGYLEQEPNTPEVRSRARRTLLNFLGSLYNRNMFQKDGGFDKNVAVISDSDNNPQSVIDARKLVIDNTVRFVEIAEAVEINLNVTREGVTSTES